MAKIKIFHDGSASKVDADVNKFIQDKIVIDLKYSTDADEYSVLVMYEDDTPKSQNYIKAVKEMEVNI